MLNYLQLIPLPEWLFLSYISQILSNYDFEAISYLDSLIKKLAQQYANGLYFPFKLSYNHYKHSKLPGHQEKQHVHKLEALLSNPQLDKFSKSVMTLCVPIKMIYTHVKKFHQALFEENVTTNDQFQAMLLEILLILFGNEMFGEEFKSIQEFKAILEGLQILNCKCNNIFL